MYLFSSTRQHRVFKIFWINDERLKRKSNARRQFFRAIKCRRNVVFCYRIYVAAACFRTFRDVCLFEFEGADSGVKVTSEVLSYCHFHALHVPE